MARVVYLTSQRAGLKRRKRGAGFCYFDSKGTLVTRRRDLERIDALRIPPAWTDVWISANAHSHLQATGRDARNRKQYLYHVDWREEREQGKFKRLLDFARFLPAFRKVTRRALGERGLGKQKILAAVCTLLDRTLIRVGNEEYAAQNGSYGLTTLCNHHVQVHGSSIRLSFLGKSGKAHDITLQDPVLAPIVRRCHDLPGHELFEYQDSAGAVHDIASQDVNSYLQQISGGGFTAKDFRTWHGTVLAADALRKLPVYATRTEARRNLVVAGKRVARELGNTLAVCRRSYIHPGVFESYLSGDFWKVEVTGFSGLHAPERFAVALLQRWYRKRTKRPSRVMLHPSTAQGLADSKV